MYRSIEIKKISKEILVFCRWHRSFPPLESLKTVVVFKNKAKLYTKWDIKKIKRKSERQLRQPAYQDDPQPGTTRKTFSSSTSAPRSAERVVDPITVFSGQIHWQTQSKEKKKIPDLLAGL